MTLPLLLESAEFSNSWCVVTPTYKDHFSNTVKAISALFKMAFDTVRIFVVVTDQAEVISFNNHVSREKTLMPNFSILNLAALLRLNSSDVTAMVERTPVDVRCSFGGGSKHQWGHLKKMAS